MNIEIDLSSVKTICITLPNSTERQKRVSALFDRLNFKRWSFYDGKKGIDAIEGCALSHIDVLSSHDFTEPLLLVEDDICETPHYSQFITINDKADAVYLGYSAWSWDDGRASQSTLPHRTQTKYENGLYRISCMLSAHAILYIDGEYAKAGVKAMKDFLVDPNGNRHCDTALAKIQSDYSIYAPPNPYFFQLCPNNTYWTTQSIGKTA